MHNPVSLTWICPSARLTPPSPALHTMTASSGKDPAGSLTPKPDTLPPSSLVTSAHVIFQAEHEAGEVQERRQRRSPISRRQRCGDFCGWSFGGQPGSQGGARGGRPDSEGTITPLFPCFSICTNLIFSGSGSYIITSSEDQLWWDYQQLAALEGKVHIFDSQSQIIKLTQKIFLTEFSIKLHTRSTKQVSFEHFHWLTATASV